MKNEFCPICGKEVYIKGDDFACSDSDCEISQGWRKYLEKIFTPTIVINEDSFDWGTLFN